MVAYANTHAQLEARRDTALAREGQVPRYVPSFPPSLPPSLQCFFLPFSDHTLPRSLPPSTRVLIVGQVDSGKSSLASLLTAYALR